MSVSGHTDPGGSTATLLADIVTMTHHQVAQELQEKCYSVSSKDTLDFHHRLVSSVDFSQAISEKETSIAGRKFFDIVAQVLKGHDGSLLTIVVTRFPMDTYTLQYQEQVHVAEEALRDLLSVSKMEIVSPNRNTIDSKMRAANYEKEKKLTALYKAKYDEFIAEQNQRAAAAATATAATTAHAGAPTTTAAAGDTKKGKRNALVPVLRLTQQLSLLLTQMPLLPWLLPPPLFHLCRYRL